MKQLNAKIVILLGITILAAMGCRTVPIRDRAILRVPSGLDTATVELAIVIAVVNPPRDAIKLEHPAPQVTREIMDAIFGRRGRRVDWMIESREPGVVYAARQNGPHYLSVSVSYDPNGVYIEILRSEELEQSRSRIHQTAYRWIETLEKRIRIALSDLAAHRPPPVNPRPADGRVNTEA